MRQGGVAAAGSIGAVPERDPFIRALTDLEAVLDDNVRRADLMRKRIAVLREERAAGRSYREIVADEDEPLIVHLLTESGQALDLAGARVRRAEALALHDEGLTMDRIADAFGVTRQRVSALLRDARGDAG